jgi:gluconokinase
VIVIIAGASGSGKTTVGAMLAGRLGWPFADADDFHPAANVEKMRAGIPLTDADRWPWLRAIGAWMDEHIARGESAVVGCSALRRSYRDQLLGGRPEARNPRGPGGHAGGDGRGDHRATVSRRPSGPGR